jgi:hypothetical protein
LPKQEAEFRKSVVIVSDACGKPHFIIADIIIVSNNEVGLAWQILQLEVGIIRDWKMK